VAPLSSYSPRFGRISLHGHFFLVAMNTPRMLNVFHTMTDPELEAFARAISRVLGWAYFLCWFVLCLNENFGLIYQTY
jgi:hypothetical protein